MSCLIDHVQYSLSPRSRRPFSSSCIVEPIRLSACSSFTSDALRPTWQADTWPIRLSAYRILLVTFQEWLVPHPCPMLMVEKRAAGHLERRSKIKSQYFYLLKHPLKLLQTPFRMQIKGGGKHANPLFLINLIFVKALYHLSAPLYGVIQGQCWEKHNFLRMLSKNWLISTALLYRGGIHLSQGHMYTYIWIIWLLPKVT